MKQSSKIIGAFFSVTILVACGGNNGLSSSMPFSVTPQIGPGNRNAQPAFGWRGPHRIRRNVQAETVLYSFGSSSGDGGIALGPLINVGGTFYGTTYQGGANGVGTVFTVTPSGAEAVLYSFAGGTDGAYPEGGLLNVNGTLYGTTGNGGVYNGGTVFKITTSGAETVLHSFGASGDGFEPLRGSLINIGNTLYGTTVNGGNPGCEGPGCGTVFKITTSGAYSRLYSFAGGSDGGNPYAGLTKVSNTLYGTTIDGGANGVGTVFKITRSGAETVLYSFAGGSDGARTETGLLNMGGILYGVTAYGGTSNDGTIFKITTAGAETVLYSFKGGADGVGPIGGLTNLNGTLFGATSGGGTSNDGVIFALLNHSSPEIVVYSFAGGSDGIDPGFSMTNEGGTLYGTTETGGGYGAGTFFSLSF